MDDVTFQDSDRAGSGDLPASVARMQQLASIGFTRRKQVAIASTAWTDWMVVSKLEHVPGEHGLLKAVQAAGQHLGSEVYFEAGQLRAVRIF